MKKINIKTYIYRAISVVLAVFLIGGSVGVFQSLSLGNDPFSCMNTSVSEFIGWKFSVWQLLVNAVIFIPTILFYRKAIGFGTVFNMVFCGIFADIVRPLMVQVLENHFFMPIRIILMLIAVILLCLGVGVYASADMGLAPYDALAYILEKYTKINFSYFRIMTDVICVAIGFIFGLKLGIQFEVCGIGTIITAFGTGPIVRFFQNRVGIPLMRKLGYQAKK
jgi:uncharacterized membrane protein YczE